MKRWMKARALAVALGFAATACVATEGQVDTTFGGTGWLRVPFDADTLTAGQGFVSLVTADNGLLIGGRAYDSSSKFVPVVARIKPDGTLDNAYGNLPTQPGRSRFNLQALGFVGDFETTAIAAASDGGAYLAGNAISFDAALGYASSGVIMRIDGSGQLLATYGSAGVVAAFYDTRIQRIAALPDGRLLTLQSQVFTEDGDRRILLRRLDDHGSNDGTFAGLTIGPGDLGGAIQILGADLKVGPDGMYYVLATAVYANGTSQGTSKGVLFRTFASGVLDASYAGGVGYAYIDFGPGESARTRMDNLDFQPNGRAVVLGRIWRTVSPYSSCGVARLKRSGLSDGTFASGGKIVHTFGASTSWCSNLVVQSDRRYLLHIDYGTGPAVAALTQDTGALDASYGDEGYATPAHDDHVNSMQLDGLGRLVLSGIDDADGGIYAARLTGDVIFGSDFDGN